MKVVSAASCSKAVMLSRGRDKDGFNFWAVGESGVLGHRFTSRPSRLTYGVISFRFPNPTNDGK